MKSHFSKKIKNVLYFLIAFFLFFFVFLFFSENTAYSCNNAAKSLAHCGEYHLKTFPAGTTDWPSKHLSKFCRESGAVIDGVGPKHCSTPSPACCCNPQRFRALPIGGHIYPPFPAYPRSSPWFPDGTAYWFCNRPNSGWVFCRAFVEKEPAAKCGSLDGTQIPYDIFTWPKGTFCSQGAVSQEPALPEHGKTVIWHCEQGSASVPCSAGRKSPPPPICGSLHQLPEDDPFEATKTDWPEGGAFCERGTPEPQTLEFPRAGETRNWDCTYFDEKVRCSAERFLPSVWISTRGGLVHIEKGSGLNIKSTLYSKMPDQAPEPLVEEESTSLSTELLTLNSGNLSSVGWSDEIYELLNYSKSINISWYDTLLNRAQIRDPGEIIWTEKTKAEVTLTEKDLEVCKVGQHVYFIKHDLIVNEEGTNFFENIGNDSINGCIFVVGGNLTIGSGEYKSEGMRDDDFYTAPGYDSVRGFFLVDGVINIPFVDSERDLRDGLKVFGGLFATGGNSSINLERCLHVHNHKFPALIVFHDVRYLNLAREVFGSIGYIRDIGFKE